MERSQVMVDHANIGITDQDRAFLADVLRGRDLAQIARTRGHTAQQARLDLHRLIARVLRERPPLNPDRPQASPLS